MATEAQEKCVVAGMALVRETGSFKKATPIIFRENLKGMITSDESKISHSELAMHVGAAGRDILAFAMTGGSSALVAYDDGEGGCGYTFGLASELFTLSFIEKINKRWEKRGPD